MTNMISHPSLFNQIQLDGAFQTTTNSTETSVISEPVGSVFKACEPQKWQKNKMYYVASLISIISITTLQDH